MRFSPMRFSPHHNKAAIVGLIVYAGCLVAAVALFVENRISAALVEQARKAEADAGPLESRYAGVIMIPTSVAGRCRRMEFDNITGALREGVASACRDEPLAGNSTQGRISAIRDAFTKR
jgi:hypothetical protein